MTLLPLGQRNHGARGPARLPGRRGRADRQGDAQGPTKQGLKIEYGARVGEVETGKGRVTVDYVDAKGQAQQFAVDDLIVCIGRVPNTTGLNAEGVVAMEFKASAEDIARTCHAHPSLSDVT